MSSLPLLILGSASPRRHEIIRSLGIPFRVETADADESLDPSDPVATAVGNASLKFGALRPRFPSDWLLAADTIVFSEGRCLGKPSSYGEAVRMLVSYSGTTQLVFTGFALAAPDCEPVLRVAVSSLRFGEIGEAAARAYLDEFRTTDRAGAYDIASFHPHVARTVGSYSNIRGLPRSLVRDTLVSLGYPVPKA